MSGVDEFGPSGPIRPDVVGPAEQCRNFVVIGKPVSGKSSFIPQLLADAVQHAEQQKPGERNGRHR